MGAVSFFLVFLAIVLIGATLWAGTGGSRGLLRRFRRSTAPDAGRPVPDAGTDVAAAPGGPDTAVADAGTDTAAAHGGQDTAVAADAGTDVAAAPPGPETAVADAGTDAAAAHAAGTDAAAASAVGSDSRGTEAAGKKGAKPDAPARGLLFGGFEQPPANLPPVLLPAEAAPADIDRIRFSLGLRGYRMDQVDQVLDELRDQIAAKDEEVARLRARLAVADRTDADRVVPQRAAPPESGA
jgi:DivIVA domain-containing protein